MLHFVVLGLALSTDERLAQLEERLARQDHELAVLKVMQPLRKPLFGQTAGLPTCMPFEEPPSILGDFVGPKGSLQVQANSTTLHDFTAPARWRFEETSPANKYFAVWHMEMDCRKVKKAGPEDDPQPHEVSCVGGRWMDSPSVCQWVWNCRFTLQCVKHRDTGIMLISPLEFHEHGAVRRFVAAGLEMGPDYLLPGGGTSPFHEAGTYQYLMERSA